MRRNSKNEKGKEENQKFKGKMDKKTEDFFFHFQEMTEIFKRSIKMEISNIYRGKPNISQGQNQEK